MRFIDKVDSYLNTYVTADNKEGILKVAAEDNVTSDDLVAYHNLVEGNIFTGENLLKVANVENSDSKLVQLGLTIDKVATEGLDDSIILKTAEELGLDQEDVAFVIDNLQRQAIEAGVVETNPEFEKQAEEFEQIADAVTLLKQAGLNPKAAIELALNIDENGQPLDEKVAAELTQLSENDLDKIATAMEVIGEITPNKARMILDLI